MKLNNEKEEPLYRQLENILRTEIAAGVYPAGGRLPTEREISERYQVSRITVRGALEGLARDRCLVRRQGRGTFVAQEKPAVPDKQAFGGFTEMCRAQGRKPGGRVLRCVFEHAAAEDFAGLGLSPGGRVVVVERVRYADGVPVALETCRFTDRFVCLLDEDLGAASLHTLLDEKCGVRFEIPRRTLSIRPASYEEAHYLSVESGHPLLCVRGVVRDILGHKAYLLSQLIDAERFEPVF